MGIAALTIRIKPKTWETCFSPRDDDTKTALGLEFRLIAFVSRDCNWQGWSALRASWSL